MKQSVQTVEQAASPEADLDLAQFFPYRLARLAEDVSQALAAIYRERFDLTRQEWRVLATLARENALTAMEVGSRTALDKMQVSRAVGAMQARGLLRRRADRADRRNKPLSLTSSGRRLYARIVPLALERERALLTELTAAERVMLTKVLDQVSATAQQLTRS